MSNTIPKNIKIGLVLCSFAGLASVVNAKTLFIDLNNAEPEIEAVKAGVAGKQEQVIVLPSYEKISKKNRLEIIRHQKNVDKFTEEAQECAVKVKKPKSCSNVYDRIRQSELARERLTGNYSAEDLEKELLEVAQKHAASPFKMVVISGHHENGYYLGELAAIRSAHLAKLVGQLPQVFEPVGTLLFLGCKTGTKDNYANTIAPMFPTIPVVVAAEDNAPLRDEPRNIAFVRKIMAKRDLLVEAKNPKIVESIHSGLLGHRWPVSILWRQKLAFFKDSIEPVYPSSTIQDPTLKYGS
jgi:hypothetical protein